MPIDETTLSNNIEQALKENAVWNIRRIRPRVQQALAGDLAKDFLEQMNAPALLEEKIEETGRHLEDLGLIIESVLGITTAIRQTCLSLDGKDTTQFDAVDRYANLLTKGFFNAWMNKLRREAEITAKAWNRIPDDKK
jgi:hypothetical protein